MARHQLLIVVTTRRSGRWGRRVPRIIDEPGGRTRPNSPNPLRTRHASATARGSRAHVCSRNSRGLENAIGVTRHRIKRHFVVGRQLDEQRRQLTGRSRQSSGRWGRRRRPEQPAPTEGSAALAPGATSCHRPTAASMSAKCSHETALRLTATSSTAWRSARASPTADDEPAEDLERGIGVKNAHRR